MHSHALAGLVIMGLMLAAAVAGVLGTSAPACGQVALYEEPMVMTELELAGFRRVFRTSASQEAAIGALVEAARADMRRTETRGRALGEAWRAVPKEQRTPEARAKYLRDVTALEPSAEQLRARLLADLKLVLTEEQRGRCKKFEYFLRRERWMAHHNGWNWLARVNLVAIVDRLGLSEEERAPIAAMMETYERELDVVLTDLEREFEAMGARMRTLQDQNKRDDADAMKAAGAAHRQVTRRLITLNDETVRHLAAVIPVERAKELRRLFERAALSEAFGPSYTDLAIRSAASVSGLTEETRDKVRRMMNEYIPRYEEKCLRIAAMERIMRYGDIAQGLDDWDSVRFARQHLLGDTHDAIKALLTDAQYKAMMESGAAKERELRAQVSR